MVDLREDVIKEIARLDKLASDESLRPHERDEYYRQLMRVCRENRVVIVDGNTNDGEPAILVFPIVALKNGCIYSERIPKGEKLMEISWDQKGEVRWRKS